jgi:hypothetical protein
MEIPQRRQIWRQKKDESLVGIRAVDGGNVFFYLMDGPSQITDLKLSVAKFLSRFTREFTPDELDKKWRQLVDEGDQYAKKLDEELQRVSQQHMDLEDALRDYARLKLEK